METFLIVYIAINFYIIGTLFGSFLTLATYRIPRGQDILVKRSYCPNCKHNLEFFDLIPVLSYIFHGGKCKYCKEKISVRYIIFEIVNGLVFLVTYLIFDLTYITFIILLTYIILFLIIGSYVMKIKMIKEEKYKNSEEKSKKNIKKGVFITEIVIASVVFAIFFTTSLVTVRNYNKKVTTALKKTNAYNLAIYNLEKSRATNYSNLDSYTYSTDIENTRYTVEVDIEKYSDINITKKDIIKTINVNVKYDSNEGINIKTLKLKERE